MNTVVLSFWDTIKDSNEHLSLSYDTMSSGVDFVEDYHIAVAESKPCGWYDMIEVLILPGNDCYTLYTVS